MKKEKNYGFRYGQKYELEPVRVKRFIWHVSYQYHNNRNSILENGLLPLDCIKFDLNCYDAPNKPLAKQAQRTKGLLFANNLGHDLERMWPVRYQYDIGYPDFDCNFETLLLIVRYHMGDKFDFWRIDTQKTNARWFVDPILAQEWYGWGLDSKYHYVCTPDRVNPEALTLFEFEPDYAEKCFVKWSDGVAHVSFNQLPLKRVA
jgi:hypothetical protein